RAGRPRAGGPPRPEGAHRPRPRDGGTRGLIMRKRLAVKIFPRPNSIDRPERPYPPYESTVRRTPALPLIQLPHTVTELTGPLFGHGPIGETDNDLTRQHPGEPLGERIIVAGRVLDEDGRPVPRTLIEFWQCNAAGRYRHDDDNHPAPL